ncbi:hypothetical protein [Histophilus somni]|uniref:hypothetical protein n=1 Tax=Histophilus somni TaxID=731 RepID=UPI0018EA57D3|nr:hypothetical protein [Histophilus somni]QQF79520.1 hypothetical protein JFL53_04250 [Histophilus somni]
MLLAGVGDGAAAGAGDGAGAAGVGAGAEAAERTRTWLCCTAISICYSNFDILSVRKLQRIATTDFNSLTATIFNLELKLI